MARVPGDYHFDLPAELIAQDPTPERADSRLLRVVRGGGVLGETAFAALPTLLAPGDLLVANDSRVLPARLRTVRTDTGGRVEVLLVQPAPAGENAWLALARPTRRLREGLHLRIAAPDGAVLSDILLRLDAVGDAGEITVSAAGHDLVDVADQWGDIPLPPYIRRDTSAPDAAAHRARDRARYQTVYARAADLPGASVAAPTAGLHFTPAVLDALAAHGVVLARVTLHVGPGTFRPPTADQIAHGRLHPEIFRFPATLDAQLAATRARGGRVIAVGTTSLRVLATRAGLGLPTEAPMSTVVPHDDADAVFRGVAVREAAGWRVEGVTRLFIQPPQTVTAVDGLLTNFHLPSSSLLMLVAAFTGDGSWRAAYAEALARRLRFFSYGDAMLILPEGSRA